MGSYFCASPKHNRVLVSAMRTAAGLLLRPFFELSVCGAGNLPRTGAFVLLPKHQRWEDIPLLSLACPRLLFYVAKQELFSCTAGAWFFTSLGGIPLHRRNPLKSRRHLRALVRLLDQGKGLVIFPEGTYFQDRMGPAYAGLIRFIHARRRVPFVPVGMRYNTARHPCRVQISFGRPCREDRISTEVLIARMMDAIAGLSGMQVC